MQPEDEVEQSAVLAGTEKDVSKRPKTIVYFEGIMLGTVLLRLIRAATYVASAGTGSPGAGIYALGLVLPILIFGVVVSIALTLLVSRRRSRIAMWVFIACSLSARYLLSKALKARFLAHILSLSQIKPHRAAY